MQGEAKPENWSEWRRWFERQAGRFACRPTYEEASAIADEAARQLDDWSHPVAAPAQEGAWRMVPVEPTREMWAAMGDVLVGYKQRHHDAVAEAFWKASLSAAPSPVIDEAMVERMARTLFERGRSDGSNNDPDAASWEETPADMREWITGHAKAALAAALGRGT